MSLMTVAALLCVSLLMFGGVRSVVVYVDHFSRKGENSTLPCDRLSHPGPTCSDVEWSHYKTSSSSITKVSGGKVLDSRLTLNPDCSLSVQNVTKEHTGLFICRPRGRTDTDTNVYLNVLTVSPAPPEPESQILILQCTLWRYSGRTCSAGTFVWLDQNQKVLSEKQKKCESNLTVELQSPQIRTFTCQYQENDRVQVSAEYSLMREEERVQPEEGGNNMIYIISGAVGGVLLLLLLIAFAVLFYKIKSKSSPQTTEDIYVDPQPADSVVDPENNVTYAMINHQKPKPKNQIVVEDTVTYSAVTIKKEDSNHSAIYSTVNKR